MSILWPVLGAVYLMFRFWIVEYKLHDELIMDRGHLSRYLTYYLGIAMVFAFSSNVFTLIVITALPTMIGAFLFFDLRFYKVWISEERYQKQLPWVRLERTTLHPPMIIAGFAIYLTNSVESLLAMFTLPNLIAGLILGFAPYFLWDPRFTKKQDYPLGKTILSGAIAEVVGIAIFYLYLIF